MKTKLPRQSEASFQRQVMDFAALHGWRTAHFRPARTAQGWRTAVAGDGKGFPDLVLVRERVVWAELKAEGKHPSPEQRAWIDALVMAGEEVYVWRPSDLDEVMRVLGQF